jgi:hypothetical protein
VPVVFIAKNVKQKRKYTKEISTFSILCFGAHHTLNEKKKGKRERETERE